MELAEGDVDELIGFWTLLDVDRGLLVGKRGATALGFALLLHHYSRDGRFPRRRADLTDDVIEFVARQVGVDASEMGLYEWSGRTIEYHRSQIRVHGLPLASSARTKIVWPGLVSSQGWWVSGEDRLAGYPDAPRAAVGSRSGVGPSGADLDGRIHRM